MRIVIAAVLIAASMQAGFAQAIQMASPESNKMVKTCLLQEGDVADATCHAFVLGVADTTAFYGAVQQMTPPFCIPGELAPGEMVAIYRDYLKEHHALRQFSAAALAVSAFKEAYPCE
jgi:hypothetical protein